MIKIIFMNLRVNSLAKLNSSVWYRDCPIFTAYHHVSCVPSKTPTYAVSKKYVPDIYLAFSIDMSWAPSEKIEGG